MEILNYQVSDGQSGIRIDRYLSEMNEELSRSYIQKLLKEQKITVNGSAVKANYKVQEGDEIQWNYTCDLGSDLGTSWMDQNGER